MRYLIDLFPTDDERRSLDGLREQVANDIGLNDAGHYPTAHLTLVKNIEDGPPGAEQIDRSSIEGILEGWRGTGVIELALGAPGVHGGDDERHVLFRIVDSPKLRNLRSGLTSAVKDAVGRRGNLAASLAEKVEAETRPHLTVAQNVSAERAERALAIVTAAYPREVSLHGVELALLEKGANSPYRIHYRVALS